MAIWLLLNNRLILSNMTVDYYGYMLYTNAPNAYAPLRKERKRWQRVEEGKRRGRKEEEGRRWKEEEEEEEEEEEGRRGRGRGLASS